MTATRKTPKTTRTSRGAAFSTAEQPASATGTSKLDLIVAHLTRPGGGEPCRTRHRHRLAGSFRPRRPGRLLEEEGACHCLREGRWRAPVSVRKTYIAAETHEPLAPSSLAEALNILVDEVQDAPPSALPRPEREADPKTIARLHQAIRAGKALHLRYTSMSSGLNEGQWIAPSRFTSDGESVHVRAYSFKHGEYRNYLPIRIEPDSSFEPRPLAVPLPKDEDWYTRAIIWLRPKSTLSSEQANVVRREYGFEGELLRVETRKALEFFFNRRWGIDEKGSRLERAQAEYELLPSVDLERG